jgi:hypothetical protein
MRSMVEGYTTLKSVFGRENLGGGGTYPSTTLRVVPLPTASRQGGLPTAAGPPPRARSAG